MRQELYTETSKAVFFGLHTTPIQRMLDFDYVCKRKEPSIVAIVNPGSSGIHKAFFGAKEIFIPIYPTIAAVEQKPDVMVNFASLRSAYPTTLEAMEQESIKTIAIIAEGIPERKTRILIATAKQKNKDLIGPASCNAWFLAIAVSLSIDALAPAWPN